MIESNRVGGSATNAFRGGDLRFYTKLDDVFDCLVERVRITSEGNVSIGTTSPSSTYGTLTVAGTGISIADDGSAKLQIGRYSSTVCNAYIKMGTNACSLRFTNNIDSVDLFTIEKCGNVGIGTTSPSYKLDVSGNFNDENVIRSININAGNLATARMYVQNDAGSFGQFTSYSSGFGFNVFGTNAANYTALLSSGASSNGLLIGALTTDPVIFGTDGSERMRITSGGLVSINQTSGYAIFNVTGIDCAWGEGIVMNPAPNGYNAINFRAEGRTGSCFIATWQLGKSSSSESSAGELFSLNRAGLTGGAGYRADAAQQWKTNGDSIFGFNVGIGTCTPAVKLDVNGDTIIRGSLAFRVTGTNNGNLTISDNGGGTATINNSGNSFLNITSASRTTITGGDFIVNNNVGINTTSPNEKLDVNGAIQARGTSVGFGTTQCITQLDFYLGAARLLSFGGNSTTCGCFRFYSAGQNNNGGSDVATISGGGVACFKGTICTGGHIIPTSNGSQDLGSSSLRWCTVYTSDLSLNNGIGNYTIVEGESDLFLYNNNSCKVFKFLLQEVCPEIAPAKRSI